MGELRCAVQQSARVLRGDCGLLARAAKQRGGALLLVLWRRGLLFADGSRRLCGAVGVAAVGVRDGGGQGAALAVGRRIGGFVLPPRRVRGAAATQRKGHFHTATLLASARGARPQLRRARKAIRARTRTLCAAVQTLSDGQKKSGNVSASRQLQ